MLEELERRVRSDSPRRDPRPARACCSSARAGARSSPGADIRALSRRSRPRRRRARAARAPAAAAIEALPAPVIACVDGFALGGGLELALACDLIYATDASSFGQPEVKLGLIPGFGGTVRLPRAVGLARAKELIYSGRRIGIDEAVAAGLVARRFADRDALLAGARETIAEIAVNSPTAVGLAKRVLVAATGQPTEVATRARDRGLRGRVPHGRHARGRRRVPREARTGFGGDARAGVTPA